MPLVEQLQSIVPLPIISYFGPLLIVGCFLISFRDWLQAKRAVALSVYVLAVFTHSVIQTVTGNAELAALVGGILAPTLYGILFVCLGIVRILQVPYSHRHAFQQMVYFQPNRSVRFLKGAIGGCVGGVTGSTLGALLSISLLMVTSLLASGLNLSWNYSQNVQHIVNKIVLLSGFIGCSFGALNGWGYLSLKYLGDKLIVHLTIYIFVIIAILKQFFRRKF